MVRVAFVLMLLFFCAELNSQNLHQTDYTPCRTYTEASSLAEKLNKQLHEEMLKTQPPRRNEINRYYFSLGERLWKFIERKELIKDDSLQQFLETITKRIIDWNQIQYPPKTILILKDAKVNAVSCGEGTIIINVGLISKIDSESQLAFVVAHEIAHQEMQHIRKRVTTAVNGKSVSKERKVLKELSGKDASEETMKKLREIWYTETAFSREHEREADSLGFLLIKNAGYSQQEALKQFSILDESLLQKPLNIDFFAQLDCFEFSLKEEWFRKRPSLFSKKRSYGFFERDSLLSHPDLEVRRQLLDSQIEDLQSSIGYQSSYFVESCIQKARFESIQSAYEREAFDLCLYLTLKLREEFPMNAYLTSMICKVLIGLYRAKDFSYDFNLLVPLSTAYYNEELRIVNNLLHNLSKDDIGNMAFYFLKNPINFSSIKQEHYYLLWKICAMTDRDEEKRETRQIYFQSFKTREYSSKMNFYKPYKSKLQDPKHVLSLEN